MVSNSPIVIGPKLDPLAELAPALDVIVPTRPFVEMVVAGQVEGVEVRHVALSCRFTAYALRYDDLPTSTLNRETPGPRVRGSDDGTRGARPSSAKMRPRESSTRNSFPS